MFTVSVSQPKIAEKDILPLVQVIAAKKGAVVMEGQQSVLERKAYPLILSGGVQGKKGLHVVIVYGPDPLLIGGREDNLWMINDTYETNGFFLSTAASIK